MLIFEFFKSSNSLGEKSPFGYNELPSNRATPFVVSCAAVGDRKCQIQWKQSGIGISRCGRCGVRTCDLTRVRRTLWTNWAKRPWNYTVWAVFSFSNSGKSELLASVAQLVTIRVTTSSEIFNLFQSYAKQSHFATIKNPQPPTQYAIFL